MEGESSVLDAIFTEAAANGLLIDGELTPEGVTFFAERIVSRIEEVTFDEIGPEIEVGLKEFLLDGADAGAGRLGVSVATDQVATEAELYAAKRAAELIGTDADGSLLSDSTRAMMRETIKTSIKAGDSPAEMATRLSESYAFSDSRAMTIARTEFSLATNRGLLAQYKASGLVYGTRWSTAEDEKVDFPICEINAAAGVIPLGETYPSGDEAPPGHPNCRCTLLPVTHSAHDEEIDQ